MLYTIKEMAVRRRIAYHRLLEWVNAGWVQGIPKDPLNVRSQKMLTDELMDQGLERVAKLMRQEEPAERRVIPAESGDTFLLRLTKRRSRKEQAS